MRRTSWYTNTQIDTSNIRYTNPNEFNPHVPFVINQPSPFTMATYATAFPTLSHDKRSSLFKRFLFGKSSSQPIRLSVLKLDGSSFDILVTNKATVAKVKLAVEAAFSHLPKQGDCSISWSHVWGNFCLCFERMKLLRDCDPITRFGIKNGDQLQFVRRSPVYILASEASETFHSIPHESKGSSSKSELCGDMKNKQTLLQNEVNKCCNDDGANKKSQSKSVRGLLSRRRQEGQTKGNDRAVNSTIRLGRTFPSDDMDSNESRDISCRSSTLPPPYDDYFGGFGYPTGYCLK